MQKMTAFAFACACWKSMHMQVHICSWFACVYANANAIYATFLHIEMVFVLFLNKVKIKIKPIIEFLNFIILF